MPKHIDQLGTFENFKAPWETDAGEAEIDKDKLKKYLFGVLGDKAKAQDARDEALEQVSTANTERDQAKADLAAKDPDLGGKLTKAEKDRDENQSRADKAEAALVARDVAEEFGLSKEQAKHLKGATEEELKASAEELLADFGLQKPGANPDEEDEDDEINLRRTPRLSAINSTDPARTAASTGKQPEDIEKIVAGFDRRVF